MSFKDEKIVETKKCEKTGVLFEITDKDLEFYDKISPVFNGKKYQIPTPKLCPEARQQRRLSFRNLSKIYKRKCDFSGEDVISIYSPDKEFKVYNQDIWWSDDYNPLDYGKDFDFSKPFFEQFTELRKEVPRITVLNGFSENSEYSNHTYGNKDSYLVFASTHLEKCMFGINVFSSNHTVDSFNSVDSENSYQLVDSYTCKNSLFITNSKNANFSMFLDDCENVEFCIGCKGLRGKKYYILNKEASKDEVIKLKSEILSSRQKREDFIIKYTEILHKTPSKSIKGVNLENVENSDYVSDSINCKNCFDCLNSRNLKYCSEVSYLNAEDCYDYDVWGENSSLIYETHCAGDAKNIYFSNVVWGGYNIFYSDNIIGSDCSNLFGCVGMKNNSQYCILNKQYTKAEYEELVPKIIEHMQKTGEWGEFFPASISPFGYNETVAQEYFPLTKEEALR